MDTREKVKALWESGMKVMAIEKELGCCRRTVISVLDRLGVPVSERILRSHALRYDVPQERVDKICAYYREGHTIEWIAKEYHMGKNKVGKLLRENGFDRDFTRERQIGRSGKRAKKNKCCACGILAEYCDSMREIECANCPWANWGYTGKADGDHCCLHREKGKGMMCSDCQAHLMLSPSRAGNDSDSRQKGG